MRRVFLISPFAASAAFSLGRPVYTVESNIAFARKCMADCLARGEAPYVPHLLYTQPGALDDRDPVQRQKGIVAGLAFLGCCDALVCYLDRGISRGMKIELAEANILGVEILFRRLDGAAFVEPDWRFA
jgi:hypothetical protein